MHVETVSLPSLLGPDHLRGRCVVVIDTLRATTTMAAALNAGATEIRVFATPEETRRAAAAFSGRQRMAGERRCVRIEGFDLGNSPSEMTPRQVGGATLLMTTTNGTRAILAARGAAEVLCAALVNRRATAEYLRASGRDVTLLCAGTDGQDAPEDRLAADLIRRAVHGDPESISAEVVRQTLSTSQGGRNVIAAGLTADIDFAARLDALDLVCHVHDANRVRA